MTRPGGREILVALQRGVPLKPRPFAALADALGVSEEDVLTAANGMLADGSGRRFGAVFDARRLGYRSELCALHVPDADLDRVGATVAAHEGVTHAYLRGHPPGLPPFPEPAGVGPAPNLWFTLSVLHNRFDDEVARLESRTAPLALRRFPAVRRFKIDVVFDPDQRAAGERVPGSPAAQVASTGDGIEPMTESDRAIVRALQGAVPVRSEFFVPVAAEIGISADALLGRLRAWRASGTLRRIAMIVRHRRIGFVANAMCVWPAAPDAVVAAGRRLAAWPAVTHCYERMTGDGWPYTLYAMIHTSDWHSTHRLFERIGNDADLTQGRMLGSLREFKKTSMNYFGEG